MRPLWEPVAVEKWTADKGLKAESIKHALPIDCLERVFRLTPWMIVSSSFASCRAPPHLWAACRIIALARQNEEETRHISNRRQQRTAGRRGILCPIRFSSSGMTPPIDTAISVFSASAVPMTRPRKRATMPINRPSAVPLKGR